jgi:cellulose synthase/poly-beta-1,6-N-acetylglucosamine synthase-like glycosyltransferase
MFDLLLIPVAIVYLAVLGSLFLYGINFFYLTFVTLRRRRDAIPQTPPLKKYPLVTVQLPIYNEMYVAERLIKAAAAIDYPKEKLEIQVLDDSTDETVQIVANLVNRLRKQGLNIAHLHRKDREGYKAGALKQGFEQARGEFFALFDADFVPTRDFLQQTLPHFENPEVAFVQTRWSHTNTDFSFLTFLQSLAIDAHFVVEQFGRSQAGYWFNFNGTAGVWRKRAIEEAGGWTGDTLTEDLDLSYRAFLKGWKAIYLRHAKVPAELPITFNAFRRQQHRWARGSLECAIKLLPKVWASNNPLRIKAEATFHLLGYGVHLLLFALTLLYPLIVLLSLRFPNLISLFGIALAFNFTAFAPTLFFIAAQQQLGKKWYKMLPVLLFISAFGAGMMINTVRAALQILQRKSSVFERTPKFGVTGKAQGWSVGNYQLKLDKIVYWELLFGLLNAGTVILGLRFGNPFISFYAAMFGFGLFFTSIYTIIQTITVERKRIKQTVALGSHAQD